MGDRLGTPMGDELEIPPDPPATIDCPKRSRPLDGRLDRAARITHHVAHRHPPTPGAFMGMPPIDLNWLAVIAAALSAFLLGGIWYGPLFKKAWCAEAGVDPDTAPRHPARIFATAFVCSFLAALIFAVHPGHRGQRGRRFRGGLHRRPVLRRDQLRHQLRLRPAQPEAVDDRRRLPHPAVLPVRPDPGRLALRGIGDAADLVLRLHLAVLLPALAEGEGAAVRVRRRRRWCRSCSRRCSTRAGRKGRPKSRASASSPTATCCGRPGRKA